MVGFCLFLDGDLLSYCFFLGVAQLFWKTCRSKGTSKTHLICYVAGIYTTGSCEKRL